MNAVLGWPILSFSDIADYDVGKTPSRVNSAYWSVTSGNVPWVTISDLRPYEVVSATKETTTHQAYEKVFRGRLVPAGTLLMSFKLTIGRVATLGIPAVHNEAIISIYPKEVVDQRFLAYYLSQVDYSQLQDRQIKGNTLNKAKIDRIPVPVPPKVTQERIADLLDAVREAIRSDRAALAATQTLKVSLSRQLLTTPEGADDDAWISEHLGESHVVSSGGTPSRSQREFWDGGTIPWVKTTEVDYTTITSTSEYITHRGLDNSAAKVLPAGTLLLAMYGQGVTRGKVAVLGIEAASNQACAAIQPSTGAVDGRYLYHYLAHKYDELRQMAHGGQQQNLNLDIVRDFTIAYPRSRETQAEIVEVLDALDEKARLHNHRLPVLETLFKSLLAGLMAGDYDVTELDTDLSIFCASASGGPA